MADFSFKSLAAFLILATGLQAALAAAGNYPTKPYDAMYRRANAQGQSDYRMCTDGQGHIRIETEAPTDGIMYGGDKPPKTVTIFDYPRGESYILLEKQKIAMRSPMQTNASAAPLDENRIKELGGKALGAKTMYGHPCHGWQYTANGVQTLVWTADDLNCAIHTETTSDHDQEIMHLVKYIAGEPDPQEFTVPEDYRISSMQVTPPARGAVR